MARWDDDVELLEDDVSTTGRVLGRKSAGAGPIEELDGADIEAIIGPADPTTDASLLTSGTLPAARLPGTTGDVTSPAGSNALSLAAGDASKLNSGTLNAARLPALTGDVTKPANSGVTTLAAGNAGVLNAGTLLAARTPAYTGEVTKPAGSGVQTVAATHSGSKHSDFVTITSEAHSVKEAAYGAAGDGSADDGSEINAAIAAQGAGATVIVPPGVYMTSVPILEKAGVSVIGHGRPIIRANSSFVQDATNKCLLDMYDKADPTSEISGIGWDANQKADIVVLAARITGTAQAKIRLFHNVVSGGNVSGVQVGRSSDSGSSSNVVVENNEFVNPVGWIGYAAGASAMVTYIADSWWYENIHETANGVYSAAIHRGGIWVGNHFMAQNNGGGILIDNANNTLIANNWFDHLLDLVPITIAPGNGQSVVAVNIANNRFAGTALATDNLVPAILVNVTGTGSIRGIAVKNNMVIGDPAHAFKSLMDITGVTGARSTITVMNNEAIYCNQLFTGTIPSALKHGGNRLMTVSARSGPLGALAANSEYENEASGAASIGGGAATTLDITHGLAGTPTYINIRPTTQGTTAPGISLTTVATTNDTIHLTWPSNPGAQTIYWEARL